MIIFDVFEGAIPERIAVRADKINAVNTKTYG